MQILPPLSLYIHLPWCVKKCPYCDFNSHVYSDGYSQAKSKTKAQIDPQANLSAKPDSGSGIPEQAYLQSLLKDFEQDLAFVQGRQITSIFFGGGTPSLMSGAFYTQLLDSLSRSVQFSPDIEITLEANPGASDASKFEAYRKAGINRLSLGVQSFHDHQLEKLGRIHDSAQARAAIEAARKVGFENFNIDLMHGLPGQSDAQAIADIETALSFEPTHLSWYQLTIEANTEFYSRPPTLPPEDTLWRIQELGSQVLEAHGFDQYEVSAFALPGKRAKHNLNYWEFGDYIGLGAGAHSKVSFDDSGCILRYRKSRVPSDYMQPRVSYRVGQEEVAPDDLPFEFMMNALRLKQGVPESYYEARTGQPQSSISAKLTELRAEELVQADRIQLSPKGFLFLNSVLERFV